MFKIVEIVIQDSDVEGMYEATLDSDYDDPDRAVGLGISQYAAVVSLFMILGERGELDDDKD